MGGEFLRDVPIDSKRFIISFVRFDELFDELYEQGLLNPDPERCCSFLHTGKHQFPKKDRCLAGES